MFSLSDLHLNQSKIFLSIFTGLHLLAVGYALALDLTLELKLCMLLAISFSFAFAIKRAVLNVSPFSIVSISWHPDTGLVHLKQLNGQVLQVEGLNRKVICPFCVYIEFSVVERFFPVPVIVFTDSCSEKNFRRLRVLALHAKAS